jgi:hypothetical protein
VYAAHVAAELRYECYQQPDQHIRIRVIAESLDIEKHHRPTLILRVTLNVQKKHGLSDSASTDNEVMPIGGDLFDHSRAWWTKEHRRCDSRACASSQDGKQTGYLVISQCSSHVEMVRGSCLGRSRSAGS